MHAHNLVGITRGSGLDAPLTHDSPRDCVRTHLVNRKVKQSRSGAAGSKQFKGAALGAFAVALRSQAKGGVASSPASDPGWASSPAPEPEATRGWPESEPVGAQAGGKELFVEVTVPDDMQAGQLIHVDLPDGTSAEIAVPEDSWPGDILHVPYGNAEDGGMIHEEATL